MKALGATIILFLLFIGIGVPLSHRVSASNEPQVEVHILDNFTITFSSLTSISGETIFVPFFFSATLLFENKGQETVSIPLARTVKMFALGINYTLRQKTLQGEWFGIVVRNQMGGEIRIEPGNNTFRAEGSLDLGNWSKAILPDGQYIIYPAYPAKRNAQLLDPETFASYGIFIEVKDGKYSITRDVYIDGKYEFSTKPVFPIDFAPFIAIIAPLFLIPMAKKAKWSQK